MDMFFQIILFIISSWLKGLKRCGYDLPSAARPVAERALIPVNVTVVIIPCVFDIAPTGALGADR
jgi:hypothetical protein